MSTVVCVVARVPQSRAATTKRTGGMVRVIRCEIQIVRVASSTQRSCRGRVRMPKPILVDKLTFAQLVRDARLFFV